MYVSLKKLFCMSRLDWFYTPSLNLDIYVRTGVMKSGNSHAKKKKITKDKGQRAMRAEKISFLCTVCSYATELTT